MKNNYNFHIGRITPLSRDNVDTDQIIPAEYIVLRGEKLVKKLDEFLDEFFKVNSQSKNDELKSKMVEAL